MKDEKEEGLKKKMELANKTMIEKERFYEAITTINKAPESKILKKKGKSSGEVKRRHSINDL